MNILQRIKEKLIGVSTAILRYPLTSLFLLIATVLNSVMITQESDAYAVYVYTFIVGALLSAISQQVYERFFTEQLQRIFLSIAAIILTIGFYFIVHGVMELYFVLSIKMSVTVFALTIAYIWVPACKNNVSFNDTFMAAFKAFFTSVLFSIVILIGLDAILFAIDQLLFSLSGNIYFHVLNFIATLFFPIFFFSLIPSYPGTGIEVTEERKEEVVRATSCPKLLAVLLNYVIIPIVSVYTVVLILYLIINIRGAFWTNNLLEPLLVSYSIVVIIVYILTSNVEHPVSNFFKKIVPKILLPLVLLQLVASLLKVSEVGVTHGRYYVVLFGVFALIAAIIISFFEKKRTSIIAVVFVVFSIVSIVPPVDAFTYSRANQLNLLEQTLQENDMIQNGTIVANASISEHDKKIITRTVHYLSRLDYVTQIEWLPDDIISSPQFEKTFGFNEQFDDSDSMVDYEYRYVYLDWEENLILDIEAYDTLMQLHYAYDVQIDEQRDSLEFSVKDTNYELVQIVADGEIILRLNDEHGNELLSVDMINTFEQIFQKGDEGVLSLEEATQITENEKARFSFIVNNLDYFETTYQGDMYVLIKIK